MSADSVKMRLLLKSVGNDLSQSVIPLCSVVPLCREAADLIERQQRQIEAYREFISDFAVMTETKKKRLAEIEKL